VPIYETAVRSHAKRTQQHSGHSTNHASQITHHGHQSSEQRIREQAAQIRSVW
jgi:hypothetical protein